jgi:hypothetical protein
MDKIVSINYEWKYEPADYLEEITISLAEFQLTIRNGKAEALVDPRIIENNLNIRDDLTTVLKSRFDAVQLLTHREYSLGKPSRTDITEDGKQNIYLEVETAVIKAIAGKVDIIHRDGQGNVLYDSKRERMKQQRWFAETVSKFRALDNTLDQLLKSYRQAVKDPDNEFLYLYEIRDAIASKFGSKKNSLKQLGIVEKDWNLLGELSNKRNIKQGRHRGEFAGLLRDADASELEAARQIAVGFIEKYLYYLEKHPPL